ncbi:MAG: hypothetical protein LBQ46_13755 [Treponema sp.]|nr:hypothetical protein [Treponema sp.]
MKKLLVFSILMMTATLGFAIMQMDFGIGPSVPSIFKEFFGPVGVATNFQVSYYHSGSGLGGGFHVNTQWILQTEMGGDFVWASQSNKGLWNIGVGATSAFFQQLLGFHVTTGYQWAFGNGRRRFALKPNITFDFSLEDTPTVYWQAALFFSYSYNRAKTHGR